MRNSRTNLPLTDGAQCTRPSWIEIESEDDGPVLDFAETGREVASMSDRNQYWVQVHAFPARADASSKSNPQSGGTAIDRRGLWSVHPGEDIDLDEIYDAYAEDATLVEEALKSHVVQVVNQAWYCGGSPELKGTNNDVVLPETPLLGPESPPRNASSFQSARTHSHPALTTWNVPLSGLSPEATKLKARNCLTVAPSIQTPRSEIKTDNTENRVMMTDGGQIDSTEEDDTLTDGDGRKIHEATHPTQRKILLYIVGHPEQAPSIFELQFYLTDVNNRSVVENHLENLENVDLVESAEIKKGERSRNLPWKFWTFADGAREFLEKNNVVPSDPAPLQGVIARAEKPEKVKRYEDAPRPPSIEATESGEKTSTEEIDEILKRYKKTGDERQAGREITELEGDESDELSTKKPANGGVLEQLLGTVNSLEKRVSKLEQKTRPVK